MLLALVVERFRELVEVLLALVQVPKQTNVYMYVCMYMCIFMYVCMVTEP